MDLDGPELEQDRWSRAPHGGRPGRSEHTQRLGSALARMAQDLAEAQRQITELRRENAALRTELSDRRPRAAHGDDA
jgi:hypothetical protein